MAPIPKMQHTSSDFEKLRRDEFSVLDSKKHTYLDFTGSGLIPASLIQQQYKLLSGHIYGNPHSSNPASDNSTRLVEQTRKRILQFFNTSEKHYSVIFTSNASNAIKLVAESFPFQRGSLFGLLCDNHNSVLGIREYAKTAGASVMYAQINTNMRASNVEKFLTHAHFHMPSLFAYPAQSNFSGVRHSLGYVEEAKKCGWSVLLDAAAFVPTSPLDLSIVQPDFIPISFYKILGLPTGVGALIVRKSALKNLRRPWFAGGTVKYSSVQTGRHTLSDGVEGFEDGTPNYLNIALVGNSLDLMDKIGMRHIHDHIYRLTRHLVVGMNRLRYPDGRAMVRVYGPLNTKERGGCVAFDVLSSRGNRRDGNEVVEAAKERMISIRAGCFCNPGAAEKALSRDFRREQSCLRRLNEVSNAKMSKCLGSNVGCVRVSVGLCTNIADLDRFFNFIRDYNEDFAV